MDELPDPYPVRKPLQHTPPLGVDASDAFYFVTICAAERGGAPFVDKADVILDAARHYQHTGKWFASLLLVMPDHIHMLVHVPVGGDGRAGVPSPAAFAQQRDGSLDCDCGQPGRAGVPSPAAFAQQRHHALNSECGGRGATRPTGLAHVVAMWKHYLSHAHGLAFQRDFFDTRIRDDAHYAEKWNYIVRNPVARGLVDVPREWPHVIAFDRATGEERPHR